jgi:hypothetical protein
MKFKYEDLKRIMNQLDRHSQKGDIEITAHAHNGSISFEYSSNINTDTNITVFPSEINQFVTIQEKKWLRE